jgi:hypothetical protein
MSRTKIMEIRLRVGYPFFDTFTDRSITANSHSAAIVTTVISLRPIVLS